MALPIGTDPKQSVYRGIEGTGAAYINKENEFAPQAIIKGFDVLNAKEQARAKQKAADQAKAQERFKTMQANMKGWQLRDGKILGDMTKAVVEEGARLLAKGVNPLEQEDYMKQVAQAEQIAQNSAEQEVLYKDLADKMWKAKSDGTLLPDEYNTNMDLLEGFASTPAPQRTSDFLQQIIPPTPKAPKEEPFDLYKELNPFIDNLGYKPYAYIDPKTGNEIKGLKSPNYTEAAKEFVDIKPTAVEKGIAQGLWKDKKEAAEVVGRIMLFNDKSGITDIARNNKNLYGGRDEEEVLNNFQQWKQDVLAGDKEAVAYLLEQKLPDNGKLESFNEVKVPSQAPPTTGLFQPIAPQQKVFEYNVAYPRISQIKEIKSKDADGKEVIDYKTIGVSPTSKMVIDFNNMTDEELFKYFTNSVQEGKALYKEWKINQKTIGSPKKSDPLGLF